MKNDKQCSYVGNLMGDIRTNIWIVPGSDAMWEHWEIPYYMCIYIYIAVLSPFGAEIKCQAGTAEDGNWNEIWIRRVIKFRELNLMTGVGTSRCVAGIPGVKCQRFKVLVSILEKLYMQCLYLFQKNAGSDWPVSVTYCMRSAKE